MTIDEGLIESLLYEEEGVDLDVKRDQYRFTGASDDDRGELLKDILAFANSWRRSDAFILIGVQEVKGARSIIVGISELLDDAAIQQFVNSKTNRPVTFSYRNLSFEGKHMALIHIPVQQRPTYLKKDFGRVKGETVYVRRGSSTAVANIDEISKMGIQSPFEQGTPDLKVSFANPKTRTILLDSENVTSLVLDVPRASEIPDYSQERRYPFDIGLSHANSSYYRDLVKYTKLARMVKPLWFAVTNSGTVTAHDVRIEMKIDKGGGSVVVMDEYDYPALPKREYDLSSLFSSRAATHSPARYDVEVTDIDDCWVVEARADKVQPKATCWFRDAFYLGSLDTRQVTIELTLYSDQLHIPFQQRLNVDVQAEHRRVDLPGIIRLEQERFRASPEYQRITQMRQNREEV